MKKLLAIIMIMLLGSSCSQRMYGHLPRTNFFRSNPPTVHQTTEKAQLEEVPIRKVEDHSRPQFAVPVNETLPHAYFQNAGQFSKPAESEPQAPKRTVRKEVRSVVKQVRKTIRRTQEFVQPQEANDVGLEGVVAIFILSAILLFVLLLALGIDVVWASLIMIVLITIGLLAALSAVT